MSNLKYNINFILPKPQIEVKFWKSANDLKYNVLKSNNKSIKIWGFYNYDTNIIRIRDESLKFNDSEIPDLENWVIGTMSIKNSISELLDISNSLNNEFEFHLKTVLEGTENWISNSNESKCPFSFHLSIYFDFKCQTAYYSILFLNIIGNFYIILNPESKDFEINTLLNSSNEKLNLKKINESSLFIKLLNNFVNNNDILNSEISKNESINLPWFFSITFLKLLSKQMNINIFEKNNLINLKVFNDSNNEYPFYLKYEFINTNHCEISEYIMKFDLKVHLDPYLLQQKMNTINIDFIKWRLIPSFEQDKFKKLKFLIIGSGTLGCNVARCLIGWGIRNFTFIDNSNVNLNNPSRQCLFTFEDAKLKKNKAIAAAERLKYICPDVLVEGLSFEIPFLGDKTIKLEEFIDSYNRLKEYILDSDVIMLLTDTKESRWIPAVLTALINRNYNLKIPKLCVTVGMGFDSFLIIRNTFIENDSLSSGCYFCGDLSINEKQSKFDIPVDQQCSVVRIGNSYFSASIAVELIISLTQHPMFWNAPHSNTEESLLGCTPQCIRGFLNNFSICNESIEKNKYCICCSNNLIDELFKNEIDTITRIFNNAKEVEDICGLKKHKTKIENSLLSEDYQVKNF